LTPFQDIMLQGIILKRGAVGNLFFTNWFFIYYSDPNQRTLEGTVVAWYPSDSNDKELVQVVFDDKSASATLTVGEFNQSRAASVAVHP
jgi:hypothetical protein